MVWVIFLLELTWKEVDLPLVPFNPPFNGFDTLSR